MKHILINFYSLCSRSFWRGRFLDRSVRDVTEETATTDLHRIRTPPRGNLCLMIIVIILMMMIMRATRPTKTWTRNYHGRIKSLSQESTSESRHKVKTEISKQPQSEEIPNTKARNLVHNTKSWTLLRYLGSQHYLMWSVTTLYSDSNSRLCIKPSVLTSSCQW